MGCGEIAVSSKWPQANWIGSLGKTPKRRRELIALRLAEKAWPTHRRVAVTWASEQAKARFEKDKIY